jgi:hypothetical protein
MFVYSVRASSVRFFGVVILTLAVLVGALVIGRSDAVAASGSAGVDFGGIKTNEDRIAFINQFGITVSGDPKEEVEFRVPSKLEGVLADYNELQKSQGLDLTRYKNKKVTRYTYEIDGFGDYTGPVCVNLIVFRNRVVACDVSSTDPSGFIEPLVKSR